MRGEEWLGREAILLHVKQLLRAGYIYQVPTIEAAFGLLRDDPLDSSGNYVYFGLSKRSTSCELLGYTSQEIEGTISNCNAAVSSR